MNACRRLPAVVSPVTFGQAVWRRCALLVLAEEFLYQLADLRCHAMVGQGGADLAAGGGEVDVFFQGDLGSDGFGVVAGGGDGGVEGVGRVELGDGECPHHSVEVPRAPLAARLEGLNSAAGGLAG